MITGQFRIFATIVAVGFLAGCASQPARDGSSFPDPSSAQHPEGLFVNLADLRSVRAGMTKAQLYPLLGPPHFNEGVFHVRQWNYLFDIPDRMAANGYTQCQYRIRFDDALRTSAFAWRPERCAKLVEPRPDVEIEPGISEIPPGPPGLPHRLDADALFRFDSARLSSGGRGKVDALLGGMRPSSRVQDILVVGYADRIGSNEYNRILSMARAESVRDYLAQAGIPRDAIHVEGRGELDPVVSCRGKAGAKLVACLQPNRRVELSAITRP